MNFYLIISIIWIVFFVLFLGFMILITSIKDSSALFPGQKNQCPDFWTSDVSGNCFYPTTSSFTDKSKKINTGDLTGLEKNSSIAPYSKDGKSFNVDDKHWFSGGQSSVCAQRDWAIRHRIIWDGVSNFNQCI